MTAPAMVTAHPGVGVTDTVAIVTATVTMTGADNGVDLPTHGRAVETVARATGVPTVSATVTVIVGVRVGMIAVAEVSIGAIGTTAAATAVIVVTAPRIVVAVTVPMVAVVEPPAAAVAKAGSVVTQSVMTADATTVVAAPAPPHVRTPTVPALAGTKSATTSTRSALVSVRNA